MKKLFVSVPMKGRTKEAIRASIEKMKKIAEIYEGEALELIDTYIEDNPPENITNQGVWYLAKSLEMLAEADVFIGIDAIFYPRGCGCEIENRVASAYGIKNYHIRAEYVIDNYNELLNSVRKEAVTTNS
jgi:hypothetical protein